MPTAPRVSSRVDRLASQVEVVRVGCAVCRADEAQVRFCWHDVFTEPPRSVDDELAALPQSETCDACGRTYALRYTVIGWQKKMEG